MGRSFSGVKCMSKVRKNLLRSTGGRCHPFCILLWSCIGIEFFWSLKGLGSVAGPCFGNRCQDIQMGMDGDV